MFVRGIASAFPEWAVDNETIASWSGLAPDFVADKLGVKSRRFLRSQEATSYLSAQACERLFAENRDLDRETVGLLLVVTQNPDFKLPHTAALVQHKLNLRKTTATFDLNLGCSGYVYALSVAKGLMATSGI